MTIILTPEQSSAAKRRLQNVPQGNRWRRGSVREPRTALQPGRITRREWLRFLDKVSVSAICRCGTGKPHQHALWNAAVQSDGYGSFSWRGQPYLAHRFALIALGHEIGEGVEPDHLCRMPRCVTGQCLELVTHKANSLRGTSPMALNATKTHCPRGHELCKENLARWAEKKGHRICKVCVNAQARIKYHAVRAAMGKRPPLTAADRQTMRDLYAGGMRQKDIAQRYNRSPAAISLIVRGGVACGVEVHA